MERVKREAKSFSKYLLVAGGSAGTDWAIFLFFSTIGLNPVLSHMMSRIAGGVFSFALNRYWSFDQRGSSHLTREGRRFLILYAFSYYLSAQIVYLGIYVFDVHPWYSKLAADVSCLLVNFIVMRGYVFSNRDGLLSIPLRLMAYLRKSN